MTTHPPAGRAGRAKEILDRHLPGRVLPPAAPGDPTGALVAAHAAVAAHEALVEFAALYGVGAWDAASFRRDVLEEAWSAWKPGSLVADGTDGLVVLGRGCPFAAAVREDLRVCALCRQAQAAMAEQAVPGARARMVTTVTEGAPSCVLRIDEGRA